jgi:hypothetical protein
MTPRNFPQANVQYGPPPDFTEDQVRTICAHSGVVKGGSCDGAAMVITCWQPTEAELAELNAGGCVFLCILGGLPPHYLTTSFAGAAAVA